MIKKLLCVGLAGAFYFIFFSSCSGIFNTSSFFSSLPDVDGSPSIPSDRFFYVKVSDASYRGRSGWDWLDYVMYEREGGPGTDCKIEKTSDSTEDMYCMLDVLEGDLYFHDIILEYNVPSRMCAYLLFQTHWHYNHPTSHGPRLVDHIKIREAGVLDNEESWYCLSKDNENELWTGCQQKVEDLCLTNSSEVTGGANCCIGEYRLRDCTHGWPCHGSKDARWGGDLRQCVGGLGRTSWEYYSEEGIPIPYIRSSVEGVRDRYTLPALAETNVNLRSTFVTANYFEGMDENDDIEEMEFPRIYQAYPSCKSSCLEIPSINSSCVNFCANSKAGCEKQCTQTRDTKEEACRNLSCLPESPNCSEAHTKCTDRCDSEYGSSSMCISRCDDEGDRCTDNENDTKEVCKAECTGELDETACNRRCDSIDLECTRNLNTCKDACRSVGVICNRICDSTNTGCTASSNACSNDNQEDCPCNTAEALCKRRCASANFDPSYRPPDQGWDMEGTCKRGLCNPPVEYACRAGGTIITACKTRCEAGDDGNSCRTQCDGYANDTDACLNDESDIANGVKTAFERCEYYCENTIEKTCSDVCEEFRSNCCGDECVMNAENSEETCKTTTCTTTNNTCIKNCTADSLCEDICTEQTLSVAGSSVTLDDLSYPYITWTCQDEGRELKHRIHLIIREWNTREEFDEFKDSGGVSGDADVTGDGDTCGREGESRCNDLYDVDDFINNPTDALRRPSSMPGAMCQRDARGQSPCVKYGN